VSKSTPQNVHLAYDNGMLLQVTLPVQASIKTQIKNRYMKDQGYATTLVLSKSPEEVFNAVNNVRGWWSEQIEGRTDALDQVFKYHYQDVHRSQMKIIEFIPNSRLVWRVEDNYFNFIKDNSEWKGTTISFDIEKSGNNTILQFKHIGLVPAYECYNICADAWKNYIEVSLKDLIETGKGRPNPYQTSIDSAAEKKNSNESFSVSYLIDKAPATVFNAINAVDKWWSADFKGFSESVADEFEVSFADIHYSRHKVLEMLPFKRIVWVVLDSKLSFLKDPSEWNGTKNVFEISTEEGQTRLSFTHVGLVPSIECFNDCSKGWKHYLEKSLLPYILEGKVVPTV
jgi:uncharacterized protein YndB with AHSA1/START domain